MKTNILSASFVAILLLVSVSFAQVGTPNQFWGSATVDSAPAADGIAVTATVNGVQRGSATTLNGSYSILVDDPNNSNSGKTVTLFLSGIQAATSIFTTGGITEINLSVTTPPPAPSSGGSGGSPSGGGGGGGGGGGAPPATGNVISNQQSNQSSSSSSGSCTERWLCTDWPSCSEGLQTRTCEDVNKCGSEANKPLESQPCSTIGSNAGNAGINTNVPSLTAFVIGSPETTAAGAIVVVLIILAIVIWFWKKKSKGPKSKGQTNLKSILSDSFGKK